MKKFLSLVLALVMAMSLVTVSAGAAGFSDKSDIDYSEAISVMNAVGVVNGYSDGTFRPDAVLTRGAASKIICNMLLGSTSADALSVNSAPFSDVAADSTFAGYIAYMVKEGIVSGYADGTFRPGANLTGYAFMKMLLTALGYDAKSEGYVGANWSVAVAKRALSIGLDKGLGETFNGLRPVTRQEACLYALNTLKADMVDYGQNFTVSTNQGVTITSNAKAEPVTSKTLDSGDNIDNTRATGDDAGAYIVQLGEKVFTKLHLYDATDDFGHPCNKWTLNNTTIGKYAKTPAVVFDKSTSASKIVNAMTGYEIWAKATGDATYKYVKVDDTKEYASVKPVKAYYANGVDSATEDIQKDGEDRTIAAWLKSLTKNNDSLVEIYTNSNNYVTYIVNTTFCAGKVERVATDSKGTTSYRIEPVKAYNDTPSVSGKTYAKDSATDDTIVLASAVKVDDIVTYVKLNNSITYVYPTTKTSGTVSKVTKDADEITMGGTTYNMSTENKNLVAATDKADLYVDYLGRVAWADAVGTSEVYYVASAWKTNTKGTPHYYAQLVSMKGAIEEIEITPDSWTALCNGGSEFDTAKRGVVAKGTSSNGKTPLTFDPKWTFKAPTLITDKAADSKMFLDGSANTHYIKDGVQLLYVKDGGEDLKVSLVDGMQKIKAGTSLYIVTDDTETEATASIETIVVMEKSAAATADKLLFMADYEQKAGSATDKKDKKAYTQKFYLDGEDNIYMLEDGAMKYTGFYEFSIDEETGRYNLDLFEDMAVLYIEGTDDYKGVIMSKRYIDMYTISVDTKGDPSKTGTLADGDAEHPYDAKKATFYDLTDYNISSMSALYDVLFDEDNDETVKLVLFALFDEDKETITTMYVIDAEDDYKADGGPSSWEVLCN